ncbi:MAG: hypothetical protein AB7O56_05620 [Bauldia sp.]
MKKVASLLFVLLLGACTMAGPQTFPTGPAQDAAMIMAGATGLRPLDPPAHYAAEGLALEAAGRITYSYVSRAQAERTCNGSGACSYRGIANCRITISTHYDAAFRAAMINHERAHCAGWPANHPPY